MPKKDELDLDRDEIFLRRERTFQCVGIATLLVFITAGLAGMFGNGPLSRAAVNTSNIEVEYDRFTRHALRSVLSVTVAANAPDGDVVRVRFDRGFLSRLGTLDTRPTNAHRTLNETSATFEVPIVGGQARLELHYKPEGPGVLRTSVSAEGVGAVRIRQLVYF